MCTCVLLESTDLPNLRNEKKHKNYLLLVRSKQPAFSYFLICIFWLGSKDKKSDLREREKADNAERASSERQRGITIRETRTNFDFTKAR